MVEFNLDVVCEAKPPRHRYLDVGCKRILLHLDLRNIFCRHANVLQSQQLPHNRKSAAKCEPNTYKKCHRLVWAARHNSRRAWCRISTIEPSNTPIEYRRGYRNYNTSGQRSSASLECPEKMRTPKYPHYSHHRLCTLPVALPPTKTPSTL